jgi:hypothetical protein
MTPHVNENFSRVCRSDRPRPVEASAAIISQTQGWVFSPFKLCWKVDYVPAFKNATIIYLVEWALILIESIEQYTSKCRYDLV